MNAEAPPLTPAPFGAATGFVIAVALFVAWGLVQALTLFWLDVDAGWGLLHAAMLLPVLTWLYTGLFITAHESIHGLVWQGRPRLNRAVGRTMSTLVAFLPYALLEEGHHRHHDRLGHPEDPDGAPHIDAGFVSWLMSFFGNYVRWPQMVGMALLFNVLVHGLHIPIENAVLAVIVAPIGSALQLFTFGTFLPHRAPPEGWADDEIPARSIDLPTWLSLVTCFHFGLHQEHHEWPSVPWWKLPEARRWARRRS